MIIVGHKGDVYVNSDQVASYEVSTCNVCCVTVNGRYVTLYYGNDPKRKLDDCLTALGNGAFMYRFGDPEE